MKMKLDSSICDSCMYWKDPCAIKKTNSLCMAYMTKREFKKFEGRIKSALKPQQLSFL